MLATRKSCCEARHNFEPSNLGFQALYYVSPELQLMPVTKRGQIIREFTLILLGAGINLTIAFGLAIQGTTAVLFPTQFPTQPELYHGLEILFYPPYLALSYLFLGIIYSVIASLSSRPKRLISPFYVQLTTTTVFAVAISYVLLQRAVSWPAFFANFIVYVPAALALFFVIGRVQDRVARYLVGLNGSRHDTTSVSLIINSRLESVLECLDEIKYALQVEEEGQVAGDAYLFRTDRQQRVQRFLIVCPDIDKSRTQLVMVSYELRHYGIEKTLGAIDDENMRFEHLIRSLRSHHVNLPTQAIMERNKRRSLLPASTLAYSYALGITESKFLTLRSVPPHHKAILAGIAFLFIITTALRLESFLSDDLYRTFIVFAALSVVFDFLPLMRFRKRRKFGK